MLVTANTPCLLVSFRCRLCSRGGAQHIGYNVSIPDFASYVGWENVGSDFLLHRYRGIKKMRHPPSIPMVCAYHIDPLFSARNTSAGQCFFNSISRDGMHWCVETLGQQYAASVACLLGCVYNGKDRPGDGGSEDAEGLRGCERECNSRFMSCDGLFECRVPRLLQSRAAMENET